MVETTLSVTLTHSEISIQVILVNLVALHSKLIQFMQKFNGKLVNVEIHQFLVWLNLQEELLLTLTLSSTDTLFSCHFQPQGAPTPTTEALMIQSVQCL